MARGIEIGRGFIAVDVDSDGAHAALAKFGSAASAAFKVAAVAAGVVSGAVVKMAFDFNSLKEQSLIAFETLLGSGQKAQAMFTSLQKFAASTPFELPGLVDNARQLLGVGVAADKVIPTLTALGNTAGALGINQEHFNNILLAVTQSMGKGKLQGEELMQMVENGIPVWQLLAKATGKTVPELQKMSSEGKLIAQDVLPKLFAQMQKDYGGAMAKQATTLTGVWSSLKDNTKILAGTALKPLFDIVKNGVGVLGELAASQAGQDFATNFAAGITKTITVTSNFISAVKSKYGEEFKAVMDHAKESAGKLWDSFKSEAGPALRDAGKALLTILPSLFQLATAASGLLVPALNAVRTVISAVSDNAGSFAQLLSTAAGVVAAVAGPVIKAFGVALGVVADAIANVVHFVGDLPGPLGVLTGVVIAGAVAWRLFHGVIGNVSSALSAIKPSAIAEALTPMTKRIDNAALSAGLMTERFTGSANAGEKVAVAGSRVGNVFSKVGSALPLVGLGFLAIGGAFELTAQRARDLEEAAKDIGKGLALGGSAASEAVKRMDELRDRVRNATVAFEDFKRSQSSNIEGGDAGVAAAQEQNLKDLQNALSDARTEQDKYERSLGAVGLAQARAAQAQKDYDSAVKDSGTNSSAARIAQEVLAQRTKELEGAQRNASDATRDHSQSLRDLADTALAAANADLQLRQAQQGATEALKGAQEAVKQYGADSDEARGANLNLEASILRAAEAAKIKARADNNGKDATVIAKAETKAYTDEILRLGQQAGVNAPAALQNLIAGLSATDLRAAGAKVSFDKLGNAIIQVPGQKDIVIQASNADAIAKINAVQRELAEAQQKATIRVQVIQAYQRPAGFEGRARGGQVSSGQPYVVGEEGPEIIYPDRAGFVADHQQSQQISAGNPAGSRAGDTFNIYDATDPYGTAMYVQRQQQFKGRLK